MILIDTNVFIDHLRGFPPAMRFFDALEKRDDILFSAVTETELLAGKENDNPRSRELLLHLLGRWGKISIDNPVARLAGDLQRQSRSSIKTADALIAACALVNNAVLVTKNVKDFKGIPGLKVEAPY